MEPAAEGGGGAGVGAGAGAGAGVGAGVGGGAGVGAGVGGSGAGAGAGGGGAGAAVVCTTGAIVPWLMELPPQPVMAKVAMSIPATADRSISILGVCGETRNLQTCILTPPFPLLSVSGEFKGKSRVPPAFYALALKSAALVKEK